MCPGLQCCVVPNCPRVWVNNNGGRKDWAYNHGDHHFRAHEDLKPGGRVVHMHEANKGGILNMRYESSGGRRQWVIDQAPAPACPGPAPAPVLMPFCRPLPNPKPAKVQVAAAVPVATTAHTHAHAHAHAHAHVHPMMCVPVANFCSWIKPDAAKVAADALAAKAKRDAAAKELAEAKAHYEAIVAKVHEGKDDEWARYWKDLARYYREIGHVEQARVIDEKKLPPFDINNFWGYPKA